MITGNNIEENNFGIHMITASNSIISSNKILNNNYGIFLDENCHENNIFMNNFYENIHNAWDAGDNIWYTLSDELGNYWSDYSGIDSDENGIGDTPYNIPGGNGIDLYPLMSPFNNTSPEKPSIPIGSTSGNVGVEYSYSTMAIDSDEDQLFYLYDWGNGQTSFWYGPVDSGEECSATNIWFDQGTFQVRVKTQDVHGAESDWSDPLVVSMPKFKKPMFPMLQCFFERMQERFPFLETQFY
jgi:parallel beta-helix repeat protein